MNGCVGKVALALPKIPTTIKEIGEILCAEKCEKGRKLYFDCTKTDIHRAILIHNIDAQFWVHYFRSGIGLVNISCFSNLASAEGAVLPLMSRNITDSFEYQWFTHNLPEKYFQNEKPANYANNLSKYFIEQINPNLISPYSICFEPKQTSEPYQFVQGSLENLKEILKQALLVCEGIERQKDSGERKWISPSFGITCGNLRNSPTIHHSTEYFLNQVAGIALKENVPFTVITDSYYRRVESIGYDFVRNNKHIIYLDFQEEFRNTTAREKIVARLQLVKWLKHQASEGMKIIKYWKLD